MRSSKISIPPWKNPALWGVKPLVGDEQKAIESTQSPNEKWRDVIGYEGLYQVSNVGRIKNLKKGTILNRLRREKRKPCVQLFRKGKGEEINIEIIVMRAFHAPVSESVHIIRHIDGDYDNNSLDNLTWEDSFDERWHPERIPPEVPAEEWRDVTSYEGVYQVSNTGKVRRLFETTVDEFLKGVRLEKNILSPYTTGARGRPSIMLSMYGVDRNISLPHLVLYMFVGPPPSNGDHYCAFHIDGDIHNNGIKNLAWKRESYKSRINRLITGDKIKNIQSDERCVDDISRDYGVSPICVYLAKNKYSWPDLD